VCSGGGGGGLCVQLHPLDGSHVYRSPTARILWQCKADVCQLHQVFLKKCDLFVVRAVCVYVCAHSCFLIMVPLVTGACIVLLPYLVG
jgi:hypothetical protein